MSSGRAAARLWAVLAIVLLLFAIAPVVVVGSLSLREGTVLMRPSDFLPPLHPSFRNYREVLSEPGFLRATLNSFVVAAVVIVSNVILASWLAVTMAGLSRRLLRITLATLLFAIALPQQATVVPLFLLFQRWHLLDTYAGLVLPALIMPVNVLLLLHAVQNIPASILDAAALDGASSAYGFRRVVLPLMKPALSLVTVATFLASWSSFVLPFLLTTTSEHRTLPVAIALLKTQDNVRWPLVIAGAAIVALPVVALFLAARRMMMEGVTGGGVKG
jgi:multiple sugar transport system permease protein